MPTEVMQGEPNSMPFSVELFPIISYSKLKTVHVTVLVACASHPGLMTMIKLAVSTSVIEN